MQRPWGKLRACLPLRSILLGEPWGLQQATVEGRGTYWGPCSPQSLLPLRTPAVQSLVAENTPPAAQPNSAGGRRRPRAEPSAAQQNNLSWKPSQRVSSQRPSGLRLISAPAALPPAPPTTSPG